MKKLLNTLVLALFAQAVLAQQTIVPTTYRGAFEPAPAAAWTDSWTNWDPQNTTYGTPTVTVTNNITANTTWTSGNIYLLSGQIYVTNNATLTIQPGTVIMGDKAATGAGLFITRGAKINAAGTASQPIVFTSNQPAGSRNIGDWGGIILLGKASNNNPGGEAYVEGLAPSALTAYGGGVSPNDNDNSGVMTYVRIEYPGYVYQPNKEINGLTLGAVGRGTTIHHIQVSFSNDDSYEWFGGTVNCKYLVAFRGLDDDFDTDNGFNGTVQFGLGVRDPQIADNPSVSTSEGFESDNDPSGTTATPQTSAIFSNMTMVGPLRGNKTATIASGYRRGARIRRNSALKIVNSVFMDYVNGVMIDGALCQALASSNYADNKIGLKFKNNIVAGTKAIVCEKNTAWNIWGWFTNSSNDSISLSSGILTTPYSWTAPDFRPAAGSVAETGASFTDTTFSGLLINTNAPSIASTNVHICKGTIVTPLQVTPATGCTLRWYTVATGGTFKTIQPTLYSSVVGTKTLYVSQYNTALSAESPRTAITVTVDAVPTAPLAITGPLDACPYIKYYNNNPNYAVYTIDTTGKAANAVTNYAWSVPKGVTIVSGNGTRTLTVKFDSTYIKSTINAVANSQYCVSLVKKSGYVYSNATKLPLKIYGPTYDVCANTPIMYVAAPALYATNYTWTMPAGATLVSGQGNDTAYISFANTYSLGLVSVITNNNCSKAAAARVLKVTAAPTKPIVLGSALANANANLAFKVKTVQAGISYAWSIVSGPATITSATTGDSITLTTGANFGSTVSLSTVKISCTAVGTCQSSLPTFFYLKYSASARAYELVSSDDFNTFELNVAPNPVAEVANVSISSTVSGMATLVVMNALGQVVNTMNLELTSGTIQNVALQAENLASGIYHVQVMTANRQVVANTTFVK
jgi:hypothetical protein